jgi:hypothetical protein
MSNGLGAITATFSICTDAPAAVEDAVRVLLALRYLEPRKVCTRSFAGTAFVIVEQPGTNEAEAVALLDEVRSLATVRRAELECRLERRPQPQRPPLTGGQERIDVV